MAWVNPVTNRTASAKGKLDKTMLNRIEGNCGYLATELLRYGYHVSINVKTDWENEDFPYQDEIDRIRSNVNALLDSFYVISGSPSIQSGYSMDYTGANGIEQNIENIDILLLRMVAYFRKCGSFKSGQGVILP